ncbi:MAG TPA: twin-arginine translocation signal domain-containing protein, partial [Phycisphaerae bacterium]|nr:twin-arginine translocation signal domain-containing protein [Phycisphaerae bacterium]
MHNDHNSEQFPLTRRKFMGSIAATAALAVSACKTQQTSQSGWSAKPQLTPAPSRTFRLAENWQMQSSA